MTETESFLFYLSREKATARQQPGEVKLNRFLSNKLKGYNTMVDPLSECSLRRVSQEQHLSYALMSTDDLLPFNRPRRSTTLLFQSGYSNVHGLKLTLSQMKLNVRTTKSDGVTVVYASHLTSSPIKSGFFPPPRRLDSQLLGRFSGRSARYAELHSSLVARRDVQGRLHVLLLLDDARV